MATGLVASQALTPHADATYTPGSPSDSIDTSITIQGNVTVVSSGAGPGFVAIARTSPSGALDVGGSVSVNGSTAVGTDGVLKQTFYAP